MYRHSRRGTSTITVTLLCLAGCGSAGRTHGSAELEGAVADYNAARYESARQRAERLRHGGGPVAVQAAYVQGIAAYRLGSDDEAARALSEAASRSKGEESGRARAALGIVELRQGRSQAAAASFRTAAGQLDGEDARLASAWAVRATAGEDGSAPAGGAGGEFTIQVGAFRGRPRAEQAAQDAEALGQRHGVAPVRIVQRRDDRGQPLFVVQMGRFGSRTEASDARRRVGNLQFIVAALGG
jgi:tetratricopeptide (TPR) repeat protein